MKQFARAATLLATVVVWTSAMADEPTDAAATPVPPAAKSVSSSDAKDPNKMICKRVAVTGSYVKKTVCKTQKQMDEEKAAQDAWAAEVQRNGSWSTVSGQQ